jgi:hypothetical protein
MTIQRFIILIVGIAVLSALVLLPTIPILFHTPRFITRTGPGVYIGSIGSRNTPVGWLMPADTLVSTSYTANQTFDVSYTNAEMTVLSSSSYHTQQGTVLNLGLYINGHLRGSKSCMTDNLSGSGGWFGYGTVHNGTYTYTSLNCGVSLFNDPFPAGTLITVAVSTNHPVWIQVDSSPTTPSYELPNLTGTLPTTIGPTSGNIAPHTVTISVESD